MNKQASIYKQDIFKNEDKNIKGLFSISKQ